MNIEHCMKWRRDYSATSHHFVFHLPHIFSIGSQKTSNILKPSETTTCPNASWLLQKIICLTSDLNTQLIIAWFYKNQPRNRFTQTCKDKKVIEAYDTDFIKLNRNILTFTVRLLSFQTKRANGKKLLNGGDLKHNTAQRSRDYRHDKQWCHDADSSDSLKFDCKTNRALMTKVNVTHCLMSGMSSNRILAHYTQREESKNISWALFVSI